MGQATLQTARLELVPLGPEHKDFLYQLDSNADVMKFIGYGKPLTAEESGIVLNHLMETALPGSGLGCWAGFDDAGAFVGWWVLAPSQTSDEPPKLTTERTVFGFRVAPGFWGRGFAKEGSRELLRHGFQDLGVKEVLGDTMAINAGSRATMATCGLKHIRTFHNQYDNPPPGIEEGEVEYRITQDEWLALRK
ncbi:GNAT domain-containing protein [Dactylonectria estremocensis]|uniref:GNAT domain-containing protein n=1 Tax=Dactylonectria estremocensis TaxID=1079267 RepID=A0A9P9FFB1_9HYPO|nr:GNAT domain-containing protein [Dactylonectria estremocensis]